MSSFLVKDKGFYSQVLKIAIPIAIQNLITFAVGMMDTVMLGSLGEVQLSASALANQLQFILMVVVFGVSGGANVLISQYWGKQDTKSIHQVLAIMYRIVIVVGLAFTVVACIIPEFFMSLFNNDPEVIRLGGQYLRIMAWSYLAFAITNATLNMLRSVRTVKISIVVYLCSLTINVFLNWVLIFGNLGAPRLEIRGAAIATLIARFAEAIICLVFMLKYENKILFKLKHMLYKNKLYSKDFLLHCTPVICSEVLWSLGATAVTLIIGWMGTEVVAANSINNVMWQLVAVFLFGLSSATLVMVGNTIGAEEYDKLKSITSTFFLLSIVVGLIGSITLYFGRPFVLSFYQVSETTKLYANQIMAVTAILNIVRAPSMVNMMGILRGGGDNKFVFFLDVFFMWVLCVPLGILGAFVLHLPVPVVYLLLKSDEILKTIFSTIRIFGNKWVRNVTR